MWQSGDVRVNGLRLHYTRTGGSKPPVVRRVPAVILPGQGRGRVRVAEEHNGQTIARISRDENRLAERTVFGLPTQAALLSLVRTDFVLPGVIGNVSKYAEGLVDHLAIVELLPMLLAGFVGQRHPSFPEGFANVGSEEDLESRNIP